MRMKLEWLVAFVIRIFVIIKGGQRVCDKRIQSTSELKVTLWLMCLLALCFCSYSYHANKRNVYKY